MSHMRGVETKRAVGPFLYQDDPLSRRVTFAGFMLCRYHAARLLTGTTGLYLFTPKVRWRGRQGRVVARWFTNTKEPWLVGVEADTDAAHHPSITIGLGVAYLKIEWLAETTGQ